MNNAVLDAIRDRRSIRGYLQTQLTDAQLRAILDAALQAPSARNTQPWHFSVVQDAALIRAFEDDYLRIVCEKLPEGQRGRAEDPLFRLFYGAPTVVFISTPTQPPTAFSAVDCGIAVENMALAAHALGLGSVIVGMARDVFLSERADHYRRALQFPDGFDFSIAISLGTPGMTKAAHPIHDGLISYVR